MNKKKLSLWDEMWKLNPEGMRKKYELVQEMTDNPAKLTAGLWPPKDSSGSPSAWSTKPELEWEITDWMQYAWHLQDRGEELRHRLEMAEQDLARTEKALLDAMRTKARGKRYLHKLDMLAAAGTPASRALRRRGLELLDGPWIFVGSNTWLPVVRKPGRPKDGQTEQWAKASHAILAEWRRDPDSHELGTRTTYDQAIKEMWRREGRSEHSLNSFRLRIRRAMSILNRSDMK